MLEHFAIMNYIVHCKKEKEVLKQMTNDNGETE